MLIEYGAFDDVMIVHNLPVIAVLICAILGNINFSDVIVIRCSDYISTEALSDWLMPAMNSGVVGSFTFFCNLFFLFI